MLPAVTPKKHKKTPHSRISFLFSHNNSKSRNLVHMENTCLSVFTLFAHASSSQDVSCSTLMISLISALIFSKVKFRFFKASSTPWLPDVLVVTKILIPRKSKIKLYYKDSFKYFEIWNKTSEKKLRKDKMWEKWRGGFPLPEIRMGSSSLTVFMELTSITRCSWCVSSCCRSSIIFAIFVIPGNKWQSRSCKRSKYKSSFQF